MTKGPDWADVTEGSKGTWERLRYDWSETDRVVLTTTDSNAWGGGPATPTRSPGIPTGPPALDPVTAATARTSGTLPQRLLRSSANSSRPRAQQEQ